MSVRMTAYLMQPGDNNLLLDLTVSALNHMSGRLNIVDPDHFRRSTVIAKSSDEFGKPRRYLCVADFRVRDRARIGNTVVSAG